MMIMQMIQALKKQRYSIIAQNVKKELEVSLFHHLGLQPFISNEPQDIIIAGYPKSGNTWFGNMVAGLVYGLDISQTPIQVVSDLIPEYGRPYYHRYLDTMYIKYHGLPHASQRRIVYLMRDGRDVMVSYFHFNVALGQVENSLNGFLSMLSNPDLYPSQWHHHIETWHSNPYNADMIIIKYEDLLNNTVVELKRFCDFANLDATSKQLETVVNQASFKNMKKREKEYGISQRWTTDKPFFRRGIVGSYKDEMPQEALDLFISQSGDTLKQFGYVAQ